MSERDLAEAIHHEIISPESVEVALDLWNERPHRGERDRMWFVLAAISEHATETVLARRVSEAARTGPWNAQAEVRLIERDGAAPRDAPSGSEQECDSRPAKSSAPGDNLPAFERDDLKNALADIIAESADRLRAYSRACEERDEAREACARHIEALAVALRDHGSKTPEGLLTGIAGAQVGALLDAAASLRTGRGDAP